MEPGTHFVLKQAYDDYTTALAGQDLPTSAFKLEIKPLVCGDWFTESHATLIKD